MDQAAAQEAGPKGPRLYPPGAKPAINPGSEAIRRRSPSDTSVTYCSAQSQPRHPIPRAPLETSRTLTGDIRPQRTVTLLSCVIPNFDFLPTY